METVVISDSELFNLLPREKYYLNNIKLKKYIYMRILHMGAECEFWHWV